MTTEPESEFLSELVEKMQTGDAAARAELIQAAMGRLERLARRMLRGFPRVHRWEDTSDVLQNSLVRLLRALNAVTPGSTREFFGLAAEQIRRELLDLARHYQGPHGLGANHHSDPPPDEGRAKADPADPASGQDEMDRWAAFHEAVATLPVEEREVVMLVFYHGWTQPQIAELFQIDERTVRRRMKSAGAELSRLLGGAMPGE